MIDALLPDATRHQGNQGMRLVRAGPGQLVLQFRQFNPAEQQLESHYMMVSEQGVRLMSARFRYAWPGELDLMAKMTGLKLQERLGSWQGQPFTKESTHHVSIYERPN